MPCPFLGCNVCLVLHDILPSFPPSLPLSLPLLTSRTSFPPPVPAEPIVIVPKSPTLATDDVNSTTHPDGARLWDYMISEIHLPQVEPQPKVYLDPIEGGIIHIQFTLAGLSMCGNST